MTHKMKKLAVQSFRLKNFKAVRDSKTIKFTPLTVFIGNNGSGKSSIIEGLETLQTIATRDVDEAMNAWSGFEYVWHKGRIPNAYHRPCVVDDERPHHTEPMSFEVRGTHNGMVRPVYHAYTQINVEPGSNKVFIQKEGFRLNDPTHVEPFATGKRGDHGRWDRGMGETPNLDIDVDNLADGESLLSQIRGNFSPWQFLSMNPLIMGDPIPKKRTGGPVRLARDGANIADYLREIREIDPWVFKGIVEALKFVLPYAADLEPVLTSELGQNVYLELTEGDSKIPGWLLSTGTLRVVALLALLRHPNPPPLIVIEEIENGLDPRTIGLMAEEIRSVVESGRSQIIITTHSPHLLDLFPLQYIVLVERINGEPTFTRPADQPILKEWTDRFGPGQLYTMGQLRQDKGK